VQREEASSREGELLDALLVQLLERPLSDVTVKDLADSCGRSFWSVYHSVYRVTANREHLIRRAILRHASRIVPEGMAAPEPEPTIYRTIEAQIAYMAGIVASEPYRQLLYLLLRDRSAHPWIEEIYERRVARPLCRGLERAVRDAGDGIGAAIFFRENVVRRCLRKLEASLALPRLLPGGEAEEADQRARLVQAVAGEAMAASYAYELGEVA
jgi:hypothetical protein